MGQIYNHVEKKTTNALKTLTQIEFFAFEIKA
jgi:hypothetical protein